MQNLKFYFSFSALLVATAPLSSNGTVIKFSKINNEFSNTAIASAPITSLAIDNPSGDVSVYETTNESAITVYGKYTGEQSAMLIIDGTKTGAIQIHIHGIGTAITSSNGSSSIVVNNSGNSVVISGGDNNVVNIGDGNVVISGNHNTVSSRNITINSSSASSSGRIDFKVGVNWKKLSAFSFKSMSGSLNANAIKAPNLRTFKGDTMSGSIDINQLTAEQGNADLDLMSGNISVSNSKLQKIMFDESSGNANFSHVAASIEGESMSGNITITSCTGGDQVSSMSGNIRHN